MECDVGEKVLSGTRDPRSGDEATLLECLWIVAQKVDDVIEDFWWEVGNRRRGFFKVRFPFWRWPQIVSSLAQPGSLILFPLGFLAYDVSRLPFPTPRHFDDN